MNNTTTHAKVSLLDAMKAMREARAGLEAQIAAVLGKIKGIDAEVSSLWAMPLKLEDFGEMLKQDIINRGKNFAPRLGHHLVLPFRNNLAHNTMPWRAYQNEEGDVQTIFIRDGALFDRVNGMDDFGAALCFFFPEVVHAGLMKRIEETAGQRWGNQDMPSLADRRKRLAQLATQREALEGEKATLEGELAELNAAAKS